MKIVYFSAPLSLVFLSSCGFNPSAKNTGGDSTIQNYCTGTSYASNGATCYQTIQYLSSNGQCLWRLGGVVNSSLCAAPQPGHGGGHNGGVYCSSFDYRFEFGSCRRYESRYSPAYGRCYFEFTGIVDNQNCGRSNPVPTPTPPPPRPTSTPRPAPEPTPNPNYTPVPTPEVVEIFVTEKSVFQLETGDVRDNRRCDVAKGTRLKAKVFFGVGAFSRVKLFSDIPNCSIGTSGTSGYLTREFLQIR